MEISATHRQVDDPPMLQDKISCGVRRRLNYIPRIHTVNLPYIAPLALKIDKGINVAEKVDQIDEDGTVIFQAFVRDCGTERDAQHKLDEALV